MEYLFVVIAMMSLVNAITVVFQVRQIGWAVWLWFFPGGLQENWQCGA